MDTIDLILFVLCFFVGLASTALYHIWSLLGDILLEIKGLDK